MNLSDGFLKLATPAGLKPVGNMICKLVKISCSVYDATVDWALSTVRGIVGWLAEKETSGILCTRVACGLLRRPAAIGAAAFETLVAGLTRLVRWIEKLLVEPEVGSHPLHLWQHTIGSLPFVI